MDAPSIQRALRRRQFFRLGGVVAILGFLVFGTVTVFAGHALGWKQALALVGVLMWACFVFAVGASFYLVAARCPRCGKKFGHDETTTYRNQLTPLCLNCGLQINWKGERAV